MTAEVSTAFPLRKEDSGSVDGGSQMHNGDTLI